MTIWKCVGIEQVHPPRPERRALAVVVDLHDDDAILEADDDRNHPKDGGEDARQLVLARLLVRSGERVDAELEVDAAKGVERTGPDVAKDDSGRRSEERV